MATKKLYEEASVQNIANAIRSKNGSTKKYKIAEMATAIQNINAADKLKTYNQVRDEVQSYLDDVTYDSSDYSVSSIADYVTNTSNNYCASCKLNIKQAGKLIVCDGGNGGIITTDSFAGDNYIYNLTPNTISTYVNIVDDKVVQCGTVKATGQLRMIKSGQAVNVRDLGGWSCDGGTVKYGKLFRGGQLSAADKDIFVSFLRVTDDLDLRWDSEVTGTSSVLGGNINYKHINGCWYGGQYSANLKEEVKYAIETINKGRVLYFHCAGGADRTGTLAMILEAILGVSQSDIDKDYELTCFYAGVQTDESARRRNEHDWKSLIQFFDNYAGDTLQDRVVDYLVRQGISISDINTFRQNMINGTPANLVASSASITNNLTNATSSNSATSIAIGGSYTATITATSNHTLTGTVSVTMNGTDVTSTAYSNGIISITNVTGDIVINVVAKKATATNILTSSFIHNETAYNAIGYENSTRLSVSSGSTSTASNRVTIGYCPITSGDIVRIKGLTYATSSDGTVAIARYNSSKTFVSANRLYTGETTPLNGIVCSFDNDNSMLTITVTDIDGFIRLCGIGSTGADCVVTINEEIN